MMTPVSLHSPSIQLLTALWNLWQSLAADGAARLREECGLDLKEFIAASHLQVPSHPARLAEELQVPRYEISRLLKSLEGKGFVQRTREHADGRQILVELTPSGFKAWQSGLQTVEQVTQPYLSGLDEEKRRDLIRTLAGLAPQSPPRSTP